MNPAGAELVHAILSLGVTLAPTVSELNDFLRQHRSLIDQVQRVRPDLWDRLRTETIHRRATLAANRRDYAA